MNKYKVSALTKRDIAFVGPLIGLTDESLYLQNAEHYNPEWVKTMFAETDWIEYKGLI